MKTKILMAPMFLAAGAISLFKRHLLLLLAICVLIPSAQAESLFVVTSLSNAVAVIDFSTDQMTTQIPVGASPIRICVSPDRRKAYVSNSGSATVSVIDTVALIITATSRWVALHKRTRSRRVAHGFSLSINRALG